MAQAVGLSHTSVKRIWNAHGLKPHLTRGFKLSNDKRFVEKLQDVVGLYLELWNGGEDAASDAVLGDQAKEALDLIEPGGRGGGEVQVKARVLGQPCLNVAMHCPITAPVATSSAAKREVVPWRL
jgi:hypothetical protein